MKITRWMLNLLSVVSMVLCLATLGAGLFSLFIDGHLGIHRMRRLSSGDIADYRSGVVSSKGSLAWVDGTDVGPPDQASPHASQATANGQGGFGIFSGDFSWWCAQRDEDYFFGFCSNGYPPPFNGPWEKEHWGFKAVPHAYAAVIFLLLPAWTRQARTGVTTRGTGVFLSYAAFLTLCWFAPTPLDGLFALLFAISIVVWIVICLDARWRTAHNDEMIRTSSA